LYLLAVTNEQLAGAAKSWKLAGSIPDEVIEIFM
jgi:hypothetical protein